MTDYKLMGNDELLECMQMWYWDDLPYDLAKEIIARSVVHDTFRETWGLCLHWSGPGLLAGRGTYNAIKKRIQFIEEQAIRQEIAEVIENED